MAETERCPYCKRPNIQVDKDGYLVKHGKSARRTSITCDGTGMSAEIIRRARKRQDP